MNPDFTLFGLCLTSTLKKIAKISCLQLMKEFQIRFNHKAKRSNAKKFNFRRLPKSSVELLGRNIVLFIIGKFTSFFDKHSSAHCTKTSQGLVEGLAKNKLAERRGVIPSSRVSSVRLTTRLVCACLALSMRAPRAFICFP